MSTAVHPTTLDVANTPHISTGRLVGVELRKLGDTRAGRWLLIGIAAITATLIVIFSLAADRSEHTFENFIGITATPQGFLLPVLGILLVTSEWSQRTALTTFSLVPVRGRVLLAKVVAALIVGGLAILLALGLAALATAIAGVDGAWDGFGLDDVGKFGLLQASGVLQGLAFGLLFLNSAAAIVTYFVLPTAFTILANLWTALDGVKGWIDLATAQQPLFSNIDISGEQWAQLGVATSIWVLAPFVVGLIRVLRAEIK